MPMRPMPMHRHKPLAAGTALPAPTIAQGRGGATERFAPNRVATQGFMNAHLLEYRYG